MQSHNAIYWRLRELVAECSIQSIWTQKIYLTIKGLSKGESFIHLTSGYIAPEILEVGDPERVKRTFASDMWSLGVVIYFTMSRGEHPFSYRNPTEPNNCREEMIRRTKMLRNVSKISEYWQSADLIYQLIDPIPENRPNIYTVLLHPLFTMYNETTKNYFAYQMSRFSITHPSNLLAHVTADSAIKWYTEHYHNEFKAICDSDLHRELVEEVRMQISFI